MADKETENQVIEELRQRIRELEEKQKSRENREYKSRLFAFIFGREEHKAWTLDLYNAIHGTAYTNPDDITINTIEDVVYMGMKNDLSILVSETVNLYRSLGLYEQQSSFNPNMPVREFMYAGKLYDKFLRLSRLNRYGRKLIPLPIPKLVCFYNGGDEKDDEVTLRLSDAFREEIRRNIRSRDAGLTDEQVEAETERIFKEADPDIEAKVRMININYGHNAELLAACKPLEEYSWLVAQIRENNSPDAEGSRPGIEAAIDKAIDEMSDGFLIKELIVANRAEVKDMCLTEYNEAEAMEMFKEEGREEGREEGKEEGVESATVAHIKDIMEKLKYTIEQAMDLLSVPAEQRPMYEGMITRQ